MNKTAITMEHSLLGDGVNVMPPAPPAQPEVDDHFVSRNDAGSAMSQDIDNIAQEQVGKSEETFKPDPLRPASVSLQDSSMEVTAQTSGNAAINQKSVTNTPSPGLENAILSQDQPSSPLVSASIQSDVGHEFLDKASLNVAVEQTKAESKPQTAEMKKLV